MDLGLVVRCHCEVSLRGRTPRRLRPDRHLYLRRVIRLSLDRDRLPSRSALRANEVSIVLFRPRRPRRDGERRRVERRVKLPLMPVPRVPLLPPVPMLQLRLLRPAIAHRRPPRPRSPITARESRRPTSSAVKTRSTRLPLRKRPPDSATPLAVARLASGHWLRRPPSKMLLPMQPVYLFFCMYNLFRLFFSLTELK